MSEFTQLPRSGGTYVLLCETGGQACIQIGRFGALALMPGWYAYVGSAFGPGGLRARVGRHLRRDKPLRWHFDYLRPHVAPRAVWYLAAAERCESAWATALAQLFGAAVPLAGFGASDHPGASHLFTFPAKPSLLDFSTKLCAGSELCSQVRELMLKEPGE